jgi:enterochelin esterase-like enzyme
LPVIYLLHGLARTDSHWFDLGVANVADRLIASGNAPPFLMVMPWERTGLDLETAVVDTLIPHIEAEYNADPSSNSRAVGGISRGGGWAFRIGMGNPGLVSTIGMHSPVVLPPDTLRLPRWLESIEDQPRLWIDMGDRDTLRFDLADFIDLLDANFVDYRRETFPGEHTAVYWSAHMIEYIQWYVRDWAPKE